MWSFQLCAAVVENHDNVIAPAKNLKKRDVYIGGYIRVQRNSQIVRSHVLIPTLCRVVADAKNKKLLIEKKPSVALVTQVAEEQEVPTVQENDDALWTMDIPIKNVD